MQAMTEPSSGQNASAGRDPWSNLERNAHRRQFLQTLAMASASASGFLHASAVEGRDESNECRETAGTEGGDEVLPPRDPDREIPADRLDLGTNWKVVQRLADSQPFRLSYLTGDFSSLEEFTTQGRARAFEHLQYRPEPVDPQPEVVQRDDLGSYIREKVVFSTSPEMRVPAYVLIPKGLNGPAPAMVDLHSHGGMFLFGKEKVIDLGENHPAMVKYHQQNYDGRPTATGLVERGYVVISIDAFMFGERRVMVAEDREAGWQRHRYSEEVVAALNARCRAKESTIVKSLIFAGMTWPGVVCWDDIRTVDYLVTRPEVDARRIGCLGISMGGYRALYLAALDPRIQAAAVVGFMSTVRSMIPSHIDTHSFVHFLPTIHRDLDWPDVATLAAPRSLLVQQCSRDGLFPLEGMQESIRHIHAGYAKGGVAQKFSGRFYDTTHRYTLPMQEEAFDWFDQQLQPRP
jgi:dienelactone hydrolase